MFKNLCVVAVLVVVNPLLANPSDPQKCALHEQHMRAPEKESRANGHEEHGVGVDERHDTLGMSHEATTHSFRLFEDGGAIELRANRANDRESVLSIRRHLQEVAGEFAANDFSTPGFVHGYPPDGVKQMQALRSAITYRYEELPLGGRIRVVAARQEALKAIHAFLKFQVIEHRTADSGQVEEATR